MNLSEPVVTLVTVVTTLFRVAAGQHLSAKQPGLVVDAVPWVQGAMGDRPSTIWVAAQSLRHKPNGNEIGSTSAREGMLHSVQRWIDAAQPDVFVGAALLSPIAIRMTWTALPITSAGRFSPLGPRGMAAPVVGLFDVAFR